MTDTTTNPLLDSASTRQCEQLAEKADLQGKRAKALLALNAGDGNKVAAEKSGLTAGQVSYMLNRFKKVGMELFNATSTKKAVVKKAPPKKAVVKKVAVKKAAPAVTKPAAIEPVKAKDKKKKTKKSSKKDKAKKESKKDKTIRYQTLGGSFVLVCL